MQMDGLSADQSTSIYRWFEKNTKIKKHLSKINTI